MREIVKGGWSKYENEEKGSTIELGEMGIWVFSQSVSRIVI